MPKLYVHVTVNSPKGEYEYTCRDQESLDKVLERAKEMHPSATSFLFAIVPEAD